MEKNYFEKLKAENEKLNKKLKDVTTLLNKLHVYADINGKYYPAKNTTKQACYDVLGYLREYLLYQEED